MLLKSTRPLSLTHTFVHARAHTHNIISSCLSMHICILSRLINYLCEIFDASRLAAFVHPTVIHCVAIVASALLCFTSRRSSFFSASCDFHLRSVVSRALDCFPLRSLALLYMLGNSLCLFLSVFARCLASVALSFPWTLCFLPVLSVSSSLIQFH